MREWFVGNWLAVVTLIGVIAGAAAAIWTAHETRRLARLQQQASSLPPPIIAARFRSQSGQGDSAQIVVQLRNRADTALDILSVEVLSPKAMYLSSGSGPVEKAGRGLRAKGSEPPAARLKVLKLGWEIGEKGATFMGRSIDDAYEQLAAHFPASLGVPTDARIRFTLRWRDHAAKTFTIAVNVTSRATA